VTKIFFLLPLAAYSAIAEPSNWTGPYKPCLNSAELRKTGHMTIGVRYDVSDRRIIHQFHRAFDFWSNILDAEFHDDPSTSCSIAIVDGTKALLGNRDVVNRRARSFSTTAPACFQPYR